MDEKAYVLTQTADLLQIVRLKGLYRYKNGLCMDYKYPATDTTPAYRKRVVEHPSVAEFVWNYIRKPQYAQKVCDEFLLRLKQIHVPIVLPLQPPRPQPIITTTMETDETVITGYDCWSRPYKVVNGKRTTDFPDVRSANGMYNNYQGERGYLVKFITSDDLRTRKDNTPDVYNFDECTSDRTIFLSGSTKSISSIENYINTLAGKLPSYWICAKRCPDIFHKDLNKNYSLDATIPAQYRGHGIIQVFVDLTLNYNAGNQDFILLHFKYHNSKKDTISYDSTAFAHRETPVCDLVGSLYCYHENYYPMSFEKSRKNSFPSRTRTLEDFGLKNGDILICSAENNIGAKIQRLLTQLPQPITSEFVCTQDTTRKNEVTTIVNFPDSSPDIWNIQEIPSCTTAKDVELVMSQVTGCSRAQAIASLIKNDGDIVNAIMDLQFSV